MTQPAHETSPKKMNVHDTVQGHVCLRNISVAPKVKLQQRENENAKVASVMRRKPRNPLGKLRRHQDYIDFLNNALKFVKSDRFVLVLDSCLESVLWPTLEVSKNKYRSSRLR